MSYLRFGSELPSGKASLAYVFADGKRLLNMGAIRNLSPTNEKRITDEDLHYKHITYPELKLLLRTKTRSELVKVLMERLDLTREESEVVCDKLIEEYNAGEWQAREAKKKTGTPDEHRPHAKTTGSRKKRGRLGTTLSRLTKKHEGADPVADIREIRS